MYSSIISHVFENFAQTSDFPLKLIDIFWLLETSYFERKTQFFEPNSDIFALKTIGC